MVSSKASVLMVIYNYAPAADGGAARQAQLLAEKLAGRGRKVGVVTARFPNSAAHENLAGVDVHRVWAIPEPGKFSATFLPSLSRFLLMHGREYDIWHAHQAFYNAAIASALAPVLGRRCVVKDASSGQYGDIARLGRIKFGNWVRRRLVRADAMISLNLEMTEELLGIGVPPDRIHRIPNGVDCDRFQPASATERQIARSRLGLSEDDVIALYAGRLDLDTGTDVLLEAWRLIERQYPTKSWHLIAAGTEVTGSAYREEGQRNLQRARFPGKVEDVKSLLHASDLLIRPSRNEGMSNIVLEAMASGVPVVASRTGGLKEQVDDCITGVLVPPGSSDHLASAVVDLFEDLDRRVQMGAAGRARAESQFAVDAVVDSYERLYGRIVHS